MAHYIASFIRFYGNYALQVKFLTTNVYNFLRNSLLAVCLMCINHTHPVHRWDLTTPRRRYTGNLQPPQGRCHRWHTGLQHTGPLQPGEWEIKKNILTKVNKCCQPWITIDINVERFERLVEWWIVFLALTYITINKNT